MFHSLDVCGILVGCSCDIVLIAHMAHRLLPILAQPSVTEIIDSDCSTQPKANPYVDQFQTTVTVNSFPFFDSS